MSFSGQDEHNLDAKDRLTVPAKYRDQLADGVVLLKAPDTCLWLMPKAGFDLIIERHVSPHSPFSEAARRLRRALHSNAEETELDSAGRVRVPRRLAEAASLDGSCLLSGAGEYIEIWDRRNWEDANSTLGTDFFELAENFAARAEDG